MNKIYKDVELAISQISALENLARSKGFSTINGYIFKYGEKANNVRYNNLSMEDIIDSKETNALYTANWIDGEFVVKILGPYTQEEIEAYGFQYKDYSGIQNIVYVKWDGKLHINSSTLTNGWTPNDGQYWNEVYKIKPLELNIFMNWNTNPLNS
tara:strand:+ start:118 stop:582 length:465 start_codon:yes stop_codon:yes gene_type:complete